MAGLGKWMLNSGCTWLSVVKHKSLAGNLVCPRTNRGILSSPPQPPTLIADNRPMHNTSRLRIEEDVSQATYIDQRVLPATEATGARLDYKVSAQYEQ